MTDGRDRRGGAAPAFTEADYYARHLRLPGFGPAQQAALRDARVLVVGVGGLGCPAALYLAGMGVGRLCLCDADTVSVSNLHRQVLFDATLLGRKKVVAAAERLRAMNPFVEIEPMDRRADADWLAGHVGRFDLVLDGTDNFDAKYVINDACEQAGVPLVYGSIFQYEGQVSVFHLRGRDGSPGYSYRDVFPDPPPAPLALNCGEAGVIGVLPGVVGTLQATEAFKVLTGQGEPLSGSLLVYDALSARTRMLRLARRPARNSTPPAALATVSYDAWLARRDAGEAWPLLDVREADERQVASLGGLHIPLDSLPHRLDELPHDGDLVVYCRSGLRSARAALYLQGARPGLRVHNLAGGVEAALGGAIRCA